MHLIKNLLRKENIGILIYIALNIYLLSWIFANFVIFPYSIIFAVLVYIVYLCVIFSPLGESVLRIIFNCRRVRRIDQINKLEPIFIKVKSNARKADASIPENVKIYIRHRSDDTIKAIGKRTILISDSILNKRSEDIEALLAHEFAHISNCDPQWSIIIAIGNIFITCTFIITFICFKISGAIMKHIYPSLFLKAVKNLFLLLFGLFSGVLIIISKLFLNISQKQNEYRADRFVYNMGLGNELCFAIDHLITKEKDNIFNTIFFNSQNTNKRIDRLQVMGCDYRNYV